MFLSLFRDAQWGNEKLCPKRYSQCSRMRLAIAHKKHTTSTGSSCVVSGNSIRLIPNSEEMYHVLVRGHLHRHYQSAVFPRFDCSRLALPAITLPANACCYLSCCKALNVPLSSAGCGRRPALLTIKAWPSDAGRAIRSRSTWSNGRSAQSK